jgi:hypothetical protein
MTEQEIELVEWGCVALQLKELSKYEMDLRKKVFGNFFKDPVEGANTVEFPDGSKLKGTYKINRNLDEASVPAVSQQLAEIGVSPDSIFVPKFSLSTKGLKSLGEQGRLIAEAAFTSKPGAPALELVAPKGQK